MALSAVKGYLVRSKTLGGLARRWRFQRMRDGAERTLDGRPGVSELRGVFHRLGASPTDPAAIEWSRRIEEQRLALLASDRQIRDMVSMSWGNIDEGMTRPVSEVCAASKDRVFCLMLFDLIRTVRPRLCLEMGTCLGISGSYLAGALDANGDGGQLITMDGQPSYLEVAREVFSRVRLSNVEIVEGMFDDTLPPVLERPEPLVDFGFIDGFHQEKPTIKYFNEISGRAAPGAVLVFDDITWSDGMKRAWAHISRDPRIELAVDLHSLGVVRLKE